MKALKRVFRLVVLVLLLGGWTVAGLSLHVIRTGEKIVVIPKQSLDWRDTYVDTRHWTLDDAASHPKVVTRLIQNDKAQLLENVGHKSDLQSAIERGPQIKTAPTTKPSEQV